MNIYVGNLPYNMEEGELKGAFEAFGQVESARIVMDRETGRSRGFGFVDMTVDSEAQAAIDELNGSELGGRKMIVNEARPRQSGGGGRPGGGFRRDRGPRGDRGGFRPREQRDEQERSWQ